MPRGKVVEGHLLKHLFNYVDFDDLLPYLRFKLSNLTIPDFLPKDIKFRFGLRQLQSKKLAALILRRHMK
jgi:hypothetical protein